MKYTINAALFIALSGSSTAFSAPACTAAATAVLNGWGWENNGSCQVVANASTTTTTTTTTVVTTVALDSDCVDTGAIGDGWGWNNNTSSSCRIPTGTVTPIISEPLAPVVTPIVVSGCVDTPPLNDGWGWNSSTLSSCQVPTGPIPYPFNPVLPIVQDPNNRASSTVNIPYVSTAPTIDGQVDFSTEWAGAVSQDQNFQTTFIDNLLVKEKNGYEDYSPFSVWYAMHDGNYLYLLIKNTEDSAIAEEKNDSANHYQDDSVEIFLDGSGNRSYSYDRYDDYHLILNYVESQENWGNQGSLRGLNFDYATNYISHFSGDVYYEIAIDLNSANINTYGEFGIEIQINDDDDGGDRDAKYGWAEPTGQDRAWQSPSVFGRARITY